MTTCIAIKCSRDGVARSMCKKHWGRWRNGKDINAKTWAEKSDFERFIEKVKKLDNGCWEWQGGTKGRDDFQYGSAWYQCANISAHRLSWILHKGSLPVFTGKRDICVCHTCDNPLCVNPEHLFLGTHTDNMKDKVAKGRGMGSMTHCRRGHEFTGKNTWVSKAGLRHCKKCSAIREQNKRDRLKAGRR